MKKGRFHIFRLFFALIVVFLISFLFCRTTFVNEVYSSLFANAQSVSYEIFENYGEVTQAGETPVYITAIEVEDKEYDGLPEITISSIEVQDELNQVVTDITVTAQARVLDVNAGNNKYVEVTGFEIVGENSNNYEIAGYKYSPVLVNILPRTATLTWVTKDISGSEPVTVLPNGYIYSGIDQRKGVSASYYDDINRKKVNLFVNIVKNDPSSSSSYANEFINAGSYIANAILTSSDSNFNVVDETGDCQLDLTMNRATPQLSYNSSVTYTYTGALQSLKNYVSLNNSEQTLVFENDKFINLDEGKSKLVRVWAVASQNYKAFPTDGSAYLTYQVPSANFIKRTSEINVENMITEYTYTGQLQTVSHNAYIADAINNEQRDIISYSSKESFLDAEVNRPILIFAAETGNFNYTSKLIYININKATINTDNWYWSPSVFNYDASAERTVYLNGVNSSLVSVTYENNKATNAGVYTARANVVVRDLNNYEPINFEDNTITWIINKKQIAKPSLEDRITVYTGLEQQVSIPDSIYYEIENKQKTNAGEYQVYVELNDITNYEWNDSTTNRLVINWKINKAKVQVPHYTKELYYTGEKLTIQIPASERYTVVSTPQSEIGKYEAYLVLTDYDNYEWEDNSSQPWLTLKWEIQNNNYNSSTSILSLLILVIALTMIVVYVTLHFTIRARRRRAKRAASAQAASLAAESSAANSQPKVENASTIEKEPQEKTTTKAPQENKAKELKSADKTSATTKVEHTAAVKGPKTRKKRMLSMKKNDKRERRKKENKKLAQLKKPPAKRGRPPKKIETRGRKPKRK